jgi:hypothetical protein
MEVAVGMGIVDQKAMTVSVIVPIHDKPIETLDRVFGCHGIEGEAWDELIIILDRTPEPQRSFIQARADALGVVGGVTVIMVEGENGWRSPCIAANKGLSVVTADLVIYCPSDIVVAPGAITWLTQQPQPAVYFAKVLESKPEECVGRGHAGPVLCASDHPRPLTFLFAAPTAALKAIGGWDEAFQDGVCFEDDDLIARLWKHGLDFIFDDSFAGVHQSHPRTYFTDTRIAPNMAHMLRKHGTLKFFDREARCGRLAIEKAQGRTTFKHATT